MAAPGSPQQTGTAQFSPSRRSAASPGTAHSERPAGVPFLPGFTFTDPKRTDFRKQHVFDAKNGYGTVREPGSRQKDRDTVPRMESPSLGGRERGFASEYQPHFVEYDKKCLRFFAYFKEAVPESPLEHYRIRKCHIMYHLEDHTISISEPKTDNSGMPQGQFLRRCHIAKTGLGNNQVPGSTPGDTFYNYSDFNIGMEITFFGRTYRIYDCDEFTADFLQKQGIALSAPEPCPNDRYSQSRKGGIHFQITRPRDKEDTLRQFLDHDRKVLKFFGVWDDRDSVYGDKHLYIVYFFLADDTIQVVRQKDTSLSAENDPFISLLKRRKLPKNIVTPDFSDRKTEYYSEMDLQVGKYLFVLGRQVFIYDCDDYTRYHYRTKWNHDQPIPIDINDPSRPHVSPAIPPHTGFGSEEDSMASVKNLHPRPPRRDFRKFLLQDGEVLRFGAYMDTTVPEDIDRRFVFGIYMMDDPCTLAIFEIRARNSGRFGGKFLQRRTVTKPGTNEYFQPGDFFVGAKIKVFGHRFVLTQADEYTINYMAQWENTEPKTDGATSD